MEIKYIESLLLKFYQGESSQKEEQDLVEYFSSTSDIPDHLLSDRDIFLSLNDIKNSEFTFPKNLENDFNSFIDNLSQDDDKKVKAKFLKINWKVTIGIAASIALFVSIGALYFTKSTPKQEIKPVITAVVTAPDEPTEITNISSSNIISSSVKKASVSKKSKPLHKSNKLMAQNKSSVNSQDNPSIREGTEEDAEKALNEFFSKLAKVGQQYDVAENKITQINDDIDKRLNP